MAPNIPSNISVEVGESYTFTFLYNANQDYISHTVSDSSVISVSTSGGSGRDVTFKITGLEAGTSTIRITWTTDGNGTGNGEVSTSSISVTVTGPAPDVVPVERISLSGTTSAYLGNAVTVRATAYPTDATDKTVTFSLVSGSSKLLPVSGGTLCTVNSPSSPSTSVIKATANDGSGVTATISITWYEEVDVPTTSLTISHSAVLVPIGESSDAVTVNRLPTDTTDTLSVSSSNSTVATASIRQVGDQVGTSTWTVRISARAVGMATLTIASGSYSVQVVVTVADTATYVSDIVFPAVQPPSQIAVGDTSGLITAQSRPTDADTRGLTATVVSGAGVASVTAYNETDVGCTFSITGVSAGTATIRVQSKDSQGYYEDIVVSVVEYIPAEGLKFAGGTFHVGFTSSVAVYGLNDEEGIFEITSGSSHATIAETGHAFVRITGVSVGQFTIKVTSNRSGATASRTYTVDDQWDYDHTTEYTLPVGKTIALGAKYLDGAWMGRKLHGGNYDVTMQDSITVDGETLFPRYSQSTLIQSSSPWIRGTPTEIGTKTIYATEVSGAAPETERILITVEPQGEYTKIVHFDANLPEGSTGLDDPVPDDIVQEYTGDYWMFDIPKTMPSLEGYFFMGWRYRDHPEGYDEFVYVHSNLTPQIRVEGGNVTATLYAIWFPIDADTKVSSYNSYAHFRVIVYLKKNAQVEKEIPMTCRTEDGVIPYERQTFGDIVAPTGTVWIVDGQELEELPRTIETGEWSVKGKPTAFNDSFYVVYEDAIGIEVRYEIKQKDAEVSDKVVLIADGGAFPTGADRVEIEPMDGSMPLPDWSVVDRAGYRLSHWTDVDGSRHDMGASVASGTYTAAWVRDARGYNTKYLPHAAVRIYRALNQYIDVTYLQVSGGQVSATISENQAGSATMTLLNDYTKAGHCLMSDDCTLWSSGPSGAISTGMYVRIDDVNEDGTLSYLMDGFISTISPDAETVAIEVADRISFLSRSGTTYRRNFYGNSRTSSIFDAGHDSEGLYGDLTPMPSDAAIDGDPWWKVISSASFDGSQWMGVVGFGTSLPNTCNVRIRMSDSEALAGADRLESMTLRLGFDGRNVPETYTFTLSFRVTSGGSSKYHTLYRSISNTGSINSYDVTIPLSTGSEGGLDVIGGEVDLTITLTAHSGGGSGTVSLRVGDSGPFDLSSSYGSWSGRSLYSTLRVSEWKQVTDYAATPGDKIRVSAIEGVTDLDDSSLYIPADERVRIAYVTGSQSTISMMKSMAWAFDMIPMTAGTPADAELKMFRTGGGYALDYYQKLADVPAENGRMRAFAVRGYTTPVIVFSSRHRLADAPYAHIHYGGDSVDDDAEGIAFASFSPSMTFKRRPNLVTVRGTMSSQGSSESSPIIVAVEDSDSTDRRYGLVVEEVLSDSSVNQLVDAGRSALSKLQENDLDDWEGSVTIPGTRRDILPPTGAFAGSGEALRITDTRNGLSGYVVRARELYIDYNTCTTRIVLTNHSMIYSSGIADTAAMAITSVDVATGANSTTLFNTQYVRVKTDVKQTVYESGNTVEGHLGKSAKWFELENISILQNLNGRYIVIASAPSGGSPHAKDGDSYDLDGIRINGGATIDIRISIRPDYYSGQELILNLDCI